MKFLFVFAVLLAGCQAKTDQPVELGKVKWSRDLDQTLKTAKTSGKPVFLLFQEVPG
ncbi:MAG: hypothetical protein ACON38_16765 [Akkermansiaceae bacterium]